MTPLPRWCTSVAAAARSSSSTTVGPRPTSPRRGPRCSRPATKTSRQRARGLCPPRPSLTSECDRRSYYCDVTLSLPVDRDACFVVLLDPRSNGRARIQDFQSVEREGDEWIKSIECTCVFTIIIIIVFFFCTLISVLLLKFKCIKKLVYRRLYYNLQLHTQSSEKLKSHILIFVSIYINHNLKIRVKEGIPVDPRLQLSIYFFLFAPATTTVRGFHVTITYENSVTKSMTELF